MSGCFGDDADAIFLEHAFDFGLDFEADLDPGADQPGKMRDDLAKRPASRPTRCGSSTTLPWKRWGRRGSGSGLGSPEFDSRSLPGRTGSVGGTATGGISNSGCTTANSGPDESTARELGNHESRRGFADPHRADEGTNQVNVIYLLKHASIDY